MTYRLTDKWIWDFWLARDVDAYHLFHLQADRALGDPDLRHWNASIGHAVSTDLVRWQSLGTCFAPAPGPAWDDGTTWTGSVFRHRDRWHLFYTGTARADDCRKQRIGLATSDDLHRWTRQPGNPVLDLDPSAYEEYDPALWHDRAWRDPYVFADPAGDGFRMVFTARVNHGTADGRGVVAQARSDDLVRWRLTEPLVGPGSFGQLEVPQPVRIAGRWYMLFSTAAIHIAAAERARTSTGPGRHAGTHYYMADAIDGPWRMPARPYLTDGDGPVLYSGKIVEDPAGRPVFLAFHDAGPDGRFVGELSDPIPVRVGPDGALSLDRRAVSSAR
ncbi:MAG: family 43 glycosylhydrolase [Alphaproteobacteria bacterium]